MSSIEERLAQTTLALCRIESVTTREEAIAAHLAERCATLVGPARVRRIGNAVLAYGPERPGRPTVALLGHSDTVRPAEHQRLGVVGERVYGCGASDMKGGLAVMLELLAEAEALPGTSLLCIFYDQEEGPDAHNGLEPLCQAGLLRGTELALCLEPTDNRLQAGCVGGLHALLTFAGRRAHSARPWQGQNAIYSALPFLQRLREHPRREVRVGELTFYEVMSATTAYTENSRNVVPDRFVLNVNYRFAPGKSLAEAEAELTALVAGEAGVEFVDRAPSGRVCLDVPLLSAWRARWQLPVEAKQAWTDVARLTHHGVPAVNFGPGETAQAHQADESVPIENLVLHHRALRDLLA